jgi:predicted O-linked N-acetylglucosamine transferase (SPINDLY family)
MTGPDPPLSSSAAPEAIAEKFRRALALQRDGGMAEAETLYREILAAAPDHFDALHMLGIVQYRTGLFAAAADSIRAAVALKPDFAPAYVNLGLPLQKLRRFDEALASYDRALELRPDYANAHVNRGNALQDMRRSADALASYERALAIEPNYAEAHYNRGNALLDLERRDDAVASFDRALALEPGYAQALYNRGVALQHLRRHDEAAASFAGLLALAPHYPFAPGMLLYARMHCCDWTGFATSLEAIDDGVRARQRAAEPFGYLAMTESPGNLRVCAEVFAAERVPAPATRLWNGERYDNRKIRIGYVSGEFRQQATSILIAELFELHDRGRFELFAIDNGLDDASALRRRLENAFGEIVPVAHLGDRDAAAAIRQRKIDILVNLNGYFGRERQGVFAYRPCPVQVNYLGFPGTLGVPYIDYIVGDARVIPPGDEKFYAESVVRLPDTYQVNDRKRAIAQRAPVRAELGLPDAGVVFCCFNNNYKITPAVFDVWMRLLRAVPGSVLWLLKGNEAAARNLAREAQRRGVAPARLVFAARMDLPEHLARHRQADLFLDTLPCNAHTTASDALWAGLPVLTCAGRTFPGRVAASLLHAAGLAELVTDSLAAYEALALALARDPARLADIRERLASNRLACPLFDTERFRRHIESAYVTMWERSQRGEPPSGFDVAPVA